MADPEGNARRVRRVRLDREWTLGLVSAAVLIIVAVIGYRASVDAADRSYDKGMVDGAQVKAAELQPTIAALSALATQSTASPTGAAAMHGQDELGASLTGLKVEIADYLSVLVDLRTASENGVSVKQGDLLRISEAQAFVSLDQPEHDLVLAIYADPNRSERIGATAPVPMQYGPVVFDAVKPEGVDVAPDSTVGDAHWRIPAAWLQAPLYAALIAQRRGGTETTVLQMMPIRLAPGGRSWFQDPSLGHITGVAYAVNGGPTRLVDLPAALARGMDVAPGDELEIRTIWYRGVEDGKKIKVEADIQARGVFSKATFLQTLYEPLRTGVNQIGDVSSFKWTVPIGSTSLSLVLWRDDNVKLDSLELQLAGSQGAAGLSSPSLP